MATTTVILPKALKDALQAEAKDLTVSMATIIRWALEERYRSQAQAAGVLTAQETLDRMADIKVSQPGQGV